MKYRIANNNVILTNRRNRWAGKTNVLDAKKLFCCYYK